MNARLHRVIFNAARGLRMVVQETASSNAKGASGATGRAARPDGGVGSFRFPSSFSLSASSIALLAALAALLSPASAFPQIVADPAAPGRQRATVLSAPNGVPLVNIQSPSAAGVSRNTFRQFDVNANGAILNNSRTNTATQLGGLVQGNPYLATGAARVILNEVNSSNPSHLHGFVEVAGTRAEVILANPAGIQVDGGGFINASKVTLTTGTAQFNAGAIEGFLVRGGSIVIDGRGLDLSRTDYAAILSRALNVNAGLWANNLKVVTGANQVSADASQITPTTGTGPAPAFALDVAALGGMYAGKIVMIGSELGVGVRNAGTLSAAPANLAAGQPALSGVGEFVISTAGRLENTGTLQAAASAVMTATGLANSGTVASATELRITTQGDLANTLGGSGGTLEGARLVLASTAGDIDNRHGATIRQTGAAALTLTAPAVSNTAGGMIGAEPAPVTPGAGGTGNTGGTGSTPSTGTGTTATTGTLTPTGPGATPTIAPTPGTLTAAGTLRNDGGRLYAGGTIDLQAQSLNNAGGTLAIASLAVNQPGFSNAGGTLRIANAFSADVGQFDNTGGRLDAGSLSIATRGDLLNTDGTLNAGEVSLTVGGTLANARGTLSTPGALTVTVAGALDNTAGTLVANQAVAITAQSLDNTAGALYSARSGVQLNVAQQLHNDRGSVSAATDLALQAATLDNGTGALRAGRDAVVSVAGTLTSDGRLTAGRHTTVTAASLQGGTASVLGAGVQGDGTLAATGDLTVSTTGALTAQGQNLAGGALTLTGTALDLTGSQTTAAAIALTATQGDVTTSGATVATPGTLLIAAHANASQTLVNATGTLGAGQLDLQAANIANTQGGRIVQTGAGTTSVATGTLNNTGGHIASNGQDLRLQATTLTNTGGEISHAGVSGSVGTLTLDTARYSGAGGTLIANGALVVRASGAFDQDSGTTSARQITMDVGSLSNRAGRVLQSGTGATRIATAGALDNAAGTIATNGDDLTLSAGATLTNTLGTITHAGTGTFALDTVYYSGQRGALAGNGALVVHAGSFDQDGGSASASRIALDAASLSNRNATLTQTGADATRIAVTGLFDNTAGVVASNARDMTIAAGELVNTAGRVEHAGRGVLDLTVGSLTNSQGQIASNATLALHGGAIHNDAGRLGATLIGIDAATLTNQGGTIAQTGTGATRIAVTGDLDNSQGGTLASNGSDLTLQVGGTLSNTQGSIQHAGSGTLGITAGTFDDRHGEVLTNGGLTLRGGRFLHDGSTTRVRQLDIAVDTISNVGGDLVQTGTGATRIAATADIDNAQGRLASNAQDFTLQAGGTLTSTGGRIEHAGAGTLTLDAGRYAGAGGQLTGNGALAVTAGDFNQDGGTTTARQLAIDVATLANRAGGQIVQTGTGATRIAVAGDVQNDTGTVASNGDTTITANSLSNRGGVVRTTGAAALDITVAAALDNSAAGALGAGGNATVTAGSLNNDAARITAVGDLHATIAGSATNIGGTLAANGNTTVNAASLDSTRGTVAAVNGDLAVSTTGATTNAGGTLQAGGTTTLSNTGLDNTAGQVAGHALAIDTHGNALNNKLGTLASATTLALQTGALNNDRGLVQSGGAMTIDTHGQTLTNTRAAGYVSTDPRSNGQGGLVSGAALTLNSGDVDNTAGFIGSKGHLDASTGAVTNAGGGVIASQAALSVHTHGATYRNAGGQTQSAGDLTLDAGAIDNTASLIRSGATTTLSAARIVNADTLDTDRGIEGRNVAITTATLSNTAGAVRADLNATVTSAGLIDNTRGLLSAGDTLSLLDPNAASLGANPLAKTLQVINTGGTLVADQSLVLDAARFSGDGTTSSGRDLSLALLGDLTNNAEVTAKGNLTYATTGQLTNNGKLGAGKTLTVSGTDVVNNAGAEMRGDTTIVNAAHSLTNRGLIDGRNTQINAGTPGGSSGTVNNIGTGKIYGDHLSIAAGTVNNDSETVGGTTTAATIAARERLDLGVGVLNNREHALVFSAGDLFLGGALDANRQATGRAAQITNASATIESIGDMQLAAARIDNLNNHFATSLGAAGPTTHLTQYLLQSGDVGAGNVQISGDDLVTRYSASQIRLYDCEATCLMIPNGNHSDQFIRYEIDQSQRQTVVDYSDPGQILAGGNMLLTTDHVFNDKSRILAGGTLTVVGGDVDNHADEGQRITTQTGTATTSKRKRRSGRDRSETSTVAYAPPDTIETIQLGAGVSEGHTAYQGSNKKVSVLGSVGGVGSAAGTGTVDNRARVNPIVEVAAAIGAGSNATGQAAAASGAGSNAAAGTGSPLDSARATAAGAVGGTGANAANASSTGSMTGAAGTTSLVIRTTTPDTTLPNASLFATKPDPTSRYLVETDPRFTNLRQWLSSDYLLKALGYAPDSVQKRLGDGFYEQQLIDRQIIQLTGQRRLAGFDTNQDQYSALMNAGATFARAYGLRPGIALTAAQMAQLTSDIVWLVEQSVTLPDGTTQKVLVPQVYVRVRPGDIDGSGALLAGASVQLNLTGDLTNAGGTVAGRHLLAISAENVNALGGRLQANDVAVSVRHDLNVIGASVIADNSLIAQAGHDIDVVSTTRSATRTAGASRFERITVDQVAGLYVTGRGATSGTNGTNGTGSGVLVASAGHDMNLIGALVANAAPGGTTVLGAGNDLNLGTVTTRQSDQLVFDAKNHNSLTTGTEVGSQVQGAGRVSLSAGRDLVATAADLQAGGALAVNAGRDVLLQAGRDTVTLDAASEHTSKGFLSSRTLSTSDQMAQSTSVASSFGGSTVAIVAGRDITTQAAVLQSKEAMSLSAGRDIALGTADQSSTESHAHQDIRSATGLGKLTGIALGADTVGAKLITSSAALGEGAVTRTDAVGTVVSAGSLQSVSGRNTTVTGSTVVADNDVSMIAGNNFTVQSAQNTEGASSFNATRKSGMIGSTFNPSFGNVKQDQGTRETGITQTASQIASLKGDVTLVASNTYTQTASSVLAAGQAGPLTGGDVNILAKTVAIGAAYNTSQATRVTHSASTVLGGSASVAGISTDTLRGAKNTVESIGNTGDSRMKALGAVNLAIQGSQVATAAQSLASGEGLVFKVAVNLSRNTSESRTAQAASEAVGSSIVAAHNVNIVATGGEKDSNIQAVGSTITAGDTVNLAADNAIGLEAGKSTFEQHATNASNGASIGVGFAVGAQNGFTIELGVSQGKGKGDASDVSYTNTRVSGGKTVNVSNGGNLALKGAVIAAPKVNAEVGGDLNIESLQDTSVSDAKQSSAGLNVSLCIPPICYGVSTVGGSLDSAKAKGDFASVAEQSGIQAGDGGFNVDVKGNTDLKGGIISSTQAAIDADRNSFQTARLTTNDIENRSASKASGFALSGSVSGAVGDQSSASTPADQKAAGDAQSNSRPGGSAGAGNASGIETSTTKSGISGVAGDKTVRTGDTASTSALVKTWNTDTLVQDVQAQARITQEFGQNASAAVGAYANRKLDEANALYAQAAATSDADQKAVIYAQADEMQSNWQEGGTYRIAAHAAVGGLTGGAAGAAGAAASSLTVPLIGQQIAELDLPVAVKQALVMATGAAMGAAAGGSGGATGAFNETANNYLTSADLRSRDQKIKMCQAAGDAACEVRVLQEYDRKSAINTGELKRSSLIEKHYLEQNRTELEQLLLDPKVSEETRQQARKSIKELNTAINVIDKSPVIRDALELGLMAVDVATLGEFAAARVLTSAVVKEIVLKRTGTALSDDAAARVANNFYRDGIDATPWTTGKPGNMQANAIEHWIKHGKEFSEYQSLAQYTEAAQNFVVNPPIGTLVKTAKNGDVLLYDIGSNTFAVRTSDGVPRTMFRPDPAVHGYSSNNAFWNAK